MEKIIYPKLVKSAQRLRMVIGITLFLQAIDIYLLNKEYNLIVGQMKKSLVDDYKFIPNDVFKLITNNYKKEIRQKYLNNIFEF